MNWDWIDKNVLRGATLRYVCQKRDGGWWGCSERPDWDGNRWLFKIGANSTAKGYAYPLVGYMEAIIQKNDDGTYRARRSNGRWGTYSKKPILLFDEPYPGSGCTFTPFDIFRNDQLYKRG